MLWEGVRIAHNLQARQMKDIWYRSLLVHQHELSSSISILLQLICMLYPHSCLILTHPLLPELVETSYIVLLYRPETRGFAYFQADGYSLTRCQQTNRALTIIFSTRLSLRPIKLWRDTVGRMILEMGNTSAAVLELIQFKSATSQ